MSVWSIFKQVMYDHIHVVQINITSVETNHTQANQARHILDMHMSPVILRLDS